MQMEGTGRAVVWTAGQSSSQRLHAVYDERRKDHRCERGVSYTVMCQLFNVVVISSKLQYFQGLVSNIACFNGIDCNFFVTQVHQVQTNRGLLYTKSCSLGTPWLNMPSYLNKCKWISVQINFELIQTARVCY